MSAPIKVYVTIHNHECGTDIGAYETHEEAFGAKAAIARKHWDRRADVDGPEDHSSLSDDEVVDYYFDDSATENFIIRECDLILRRGARRMPLGSEVAASVRLMMANQSTSSPSVLKLKRIEGDTTQFGQIGPQVGDPHAPRITLYRADGVLCVFESVDQLIADGWEMD